MLLTQSYYLMIPFKKKKKLFLNTFKMKIKIKLKIMFCKEIIQKQNIFIKIKII
jgi:hypothetical protein